MANPIHRQTLADWDEACERGRLLLIGHTLQRCGVIVARAARELGITEGGLRQIIARTPALTQLVEERGRGRGRPKSAKPKAKKPRSRSAK